MLPKIVRTIQVHRFAEMKLGLSACVQNDGVHLLRPSEHTSLFI